MQKKFHSTVYTYGLDKDRFNVLIHGRQGDGSRLQINRLIKTIKAYNKTLVETKHVTPLFRIECETVEEKAIQDIITLFPNQTRIPTGNTLDAFQRLTQADGLIASYSAFSFSAYILNNRIDRMVVDAISDSSSFRHVWLSDRKEHLFVLDKHRRSLESTAAVSLVKDNLFCLDNGLYLIA